MKDRPLIGREWLLAEIVEWAHDLDLGRALAVTAPAGWGKTTVAQQVAALPDLSIAYAHQEQHDGMVGAVREPGQTLGDLFVDKLFQLTVTVPALSATRQAAYLHGLLASGSPDGAEHREERERVEREIRQSRTQAEVHEAWRSASEAVAPVAVDRMTDPAVEAETEHELEKFAALLDPNPRRIKRFLNTYTADLVTSGLEDNFLDPDALALWTIFRMRWPALAAYLRDHPQAVDHAPDDIDPALRTVLASADAQRLIGHEQGGPITATLVTRLTGRAA